MGTAGRDMARHAPGPPRLSYILTQGPPFCGLYPGRRPAQRPGTISGGQSAKNLYKRKSPGKADFSRTLKHFAEISAC